MISNAIRMPFRTSGRSRTLANGIAHVVGGVIGSFAIYSTLTGGVETYGYSIFLVTMAALAGLAFLSDRI